MFQTCFLDAEPQEMFSRLILLVVVIPHFVSTILKMIDGGSKKILESSEPQKNIIFTSHTSCRRHRLILFQQY